MPSADHEYVIVANYFDGVWKKDTTHLPAGTTMTAAWMKASEIARRLDDEYGDSHFWNVNLNSENGSIVQLFHGRLS